MSSEVEICNLALTKLGSDTIVALADNNNRARTMNLTYGPTRDAELTRRRWQFAIARASLPALAGAPLFDYDYQYQLPEDFLRLIEGGDIVTLANLSDYRTASSALYVIEGGVLLTNLGAPLNIRYLRRVTDTALFHSAFVGSLSSRLAYENCEKLTQSDSKRELAIRDYKMAISEGIRAQALEKAPEDMTDDSWMLARTQ